MRRSLETKRKGGHLDQPTNPLDTIDEIGFSKDRDPGGLGPLPETDLEKALGLLNEQVEFKCEDFSIFKTDRKIEDELNDIEAELNSLIEEIRNI